jgi:hypothetical protein
MKLDVSEIVRRLRADKRFVRLYVLFSEEALYKIPFKERMTEVENIHKTRSVRFLNPDSGKFVDALIEASINEQAQRSRLTEIHAQCIKASRTLSRGVEKLEEYLLIRYSTDIAGVRTKEERVKLIRMAMSSFHQFLNEVDTLKEMTEIIIADIDKSSWRLRDIISAYQLHNAPERTL